MPHAAVIICTRNRPADLARTLRSIAAQDLSPSPVLLLIDASDTAAQHRNRNAAQHLVPGPVQHHAYAGVPSAAGQRNLGLRLLPDATEIVFFLDDDVTLQPDCLRRLAETLDATPGLCGVGAVESGTSASSPSSRLRAPQWRHLFLLNHPQPGRVLISGHISRYDGVSLGGAPVRTQWLSTCCCAYRRSAVDTVRFDEALSGALLEDLDFSYRIATTGPLYAEPTAHFTHHRSPLTRRSVFQLSYERTVQRYWFVEKNLRHPLRKPAFWWATLGQLLATATSPRPSKWAAFHGLLRGIQAILQRNHPLLRPSHVRKPPSC